MVLSGFLAPPLTLISQHRGPGLAARARSLEAPEVELCTAPRFLEYTCCGWRSRVLFATRGVWGVPASLPGIRARRLARSAPGLKPVPGGKEGSRRGRVSGGAAHATHPGPCRASAVRQRPLSSPFTRNKDLLLPSQRRDFSFGGILTHALEEDLRLFWGYRGDCAKRKEFQGWPWPREHVLMLSGCTCFWYNCPCNCNSSLSLPSFSLSGKACTLPQPSPAQPSRDAPHPTSPSPGIFQTLHMSCRYWPRSIFCKILW